MKKLFSLVVSFSLLCLTAQSWAAPAPPIMSYTVVGSNLTITWDSDSQATRYTLNYAVGAYTDPDDFTTMDLGTQTDFSYDYLVDGTTYTIAIQAYNDVGASGFSNIETFTVPLPAPDAPVMIYTVDDTSLAVSWNSIPNATGYTLNYAVGTYNDPGDFTPLDIGDQTTFAYDSLVYGVTYTIAVQAYNDDEESAFSNIEEFTIPYPCVPEAPELSYRIDETNLSIFWEAVPEATGYSLHYVLGAYTTSEAMISKNLGNNTSFSYSGLVEGQTYTIALSSHNECGESELSNIIPFTVDGFNLSPVVGTWAVKEYSGPNTCGDPDLEYFGSYHVTILDSGEYSWKGVTSYGTISGDTITAEPNYSYLENDGVTTITHAMGTVSSDGSTIEGFEQWVWEATDYDFTCIGIQTYSGVRIN